MKEKNLKIQIKKQIVYKLKIKIFPINNFWLKIKVNQEKESLKYSKISPKL